MAKPDSRLGRGLGSLLEENLETGLEAGPDFEVAVADIRPNPYQPRTAISADSVEELMASIREHGLLQPLVVRQRGAHWEIVAGERRWRALQRLEWTTAPAVVRDLDDEQMLVVALVENLQRQELSPLEEARSYRRLADEFNLTQQEISRRVGRERSTVANALRLLTLPSSVQDLVHGGSLSVGHARAILGARGDDLQLELAEAVVREALSVREIERKVRRLKDGPAPPRQRSRKDPRQSPYVRRAQQTLERALGTEVRIRLTDDAAGEIRVVFHDSDDFERLIQLLAGESASGS